MSTFYQLGKTTIPERPTEGAAMRLKLGRMKALAIALLSEFEELGGREPLDINSGISLRHEVRRYETQLIIQALEATGGNQKRAARLLGLRPTTLNSKLKQYRLQTKSKD